MLQTTAPGLQGQWSPQGPLSRLQSQVNGDQRFPRCRAPRQNGPFRGRDSRPGVCPRVSAALQRQDQFQRDSLRRCFSPRQLRPVCHLPHFLLCPVVPGGCSIWGTSEGPASDTWAWVRYDALTWPITPSTVSACTLGSACCQGHFRHRSASPPARGVEGRGRMWRAAGRALQPGPERRGHWSSRTWDAWSQEPSIGRPPTPPLTRES